MENSQTWHGQLSKNFRANRDAHYIRAQRSIGRMQFYTDMQPESRIYKDKEERTNVTVTRECIFLRDRENDIYFSRLSRRLNTGSPRTI